MVPQSNTVGALRVRRKRTKGPFKGVRMRKWGRWVSEIRVPQSRSRIWLGSFDNPEKAARAYDAALYCLRGPKGKFNFPNEKRPDLPDGLSTTFSKNDIKAVASRFASPNCTPATSSTSPAPSSTSSFASATSSPEVPNLGGEMESTWDLGDLHCAADLQEPEFFSPESFLLEEPIMLEPDCIWNMLEEANNSSNVE